MVALPSFANEAALRALDAKCESPSSPDSARTAVQLGKLPLATRKSYLYSFLFFDLPHLVRCVLQELSADVRLGGVDNDTALCVAAIRGSTRSTQALLAGGANLALADAQGVTALHNASRYGHADIVRLLVAAGADARAADSLGVTPLITAVMTSNVECVRVLLPVSDLLQATGEGLCALHAAVCVACEECFQLLLPLTDVDVRTLGEDGHRTPLHLACVKGQRDLAKALLKRGADRMALDVHQYSPLHLAAMAGVLSCVILLVGRPEKPSLTPEQVNATDALGCTALHAAAYSGHDRVCGVLLSVGARLDVVGHGGTPLMVAQHTHPTNAALLELLSGRGPANLPGTVCDHCAKPAASVRKMIACSACHHVRYCSPACQAAAWEGHETECDAQKAKRTGWTTVHEGVR